MSLVYNKESALCSVPPTGGLSVLYKKAGHAQGEVGRSPSTGETKVALLIYSPEAWGNLSEVRLPCDLAGRRVDGIPGSSISRSENLVIRMFPSALGILRPRCLLGNWDTRVWNCRGPGHRAP